MLYMGGKPLGYVTFRFVFQQRNFENFDYGLSNESNFKSKKLKSNWKINNCQRTIFVCSNFSINKKWESAENKSSEILMVRWHDKHLMKRRKKPALVKSDSNKKFFLNPQINIYI